jgi:hypothetical protein
MKKTLIGLAALCICAIVTILIVRRTPQDQPDQQPTPGKAKVTTKTRQPKLPLEIAADPGIGIDERLAAVRTLDETLTPEDATKVKDIMFRTGEDSGDVEEARGFQDRQSGDLPGQTASAASAGRDAEQIDFQQSYNKHQTKWNYRSRWGQQLSTRDEIINKKGTTHERIEDL